MIPIFLPASVTISHSIQHLDSQGHILIFIDRMHLLFTQVRFLFWQLGRVGGQYATVFLHPFIRLNLLRCRLMVFRERLSSAGNLEKLVFCCSTISKKVSSFTTERLHFRRCHLLWNIWTSFLFCFFFLTKFLHLLVFTRWNYFIDHYPYLPTPPLGQDMTQGKLLSGV